MEIAESPRRVSGQVAQALIAFVLLSGRTDTAFASEKLTLLPFWSPRLEAARFGPANEEFAWVGWIGATVHFAEQGKWTAYFNPQVETILGHRVRSFEAVQANYSLELGVSRDSGPRTFSGFFHHVSRHVQDRDKVRAVDWNLLGGRYEAPWPDRWNRRGVMAASLAVATLSSGVEYNWEARFSGDIDVLRKDDRGLFVLLDLRRVGAEPSSTFPRSRLTDIRLELGVRNWRPTSQFALFVGYQRRSDALIPSALVINRALFGFRLHGQRRPEAAAPPLP